MKGSFNSSRGFSRQAKRQSEIWQLDSISIWRETLTSLLVGEDQRVSAAARHLNHFGLQRLDERQSHRGGFQHVVVALICRERTGKEGRVVRPRHKHAAFAHTSHGVSHKKRLYTEKGDVSTGTPTHSRYASICSERAGDTSLKE